jgi:hypothetical protein
MTIQTICYKDATLTVEGRYYVEEPETENCPKTDAYAEIESVTIEGVEMVDKMDADALSNISDMFMEQCQADLEADAECCEEPDDD